MRVEGAGEEVAGTGRGREKAVTDPKDRGFKSPYLKAFVVARINPLRFKRGAKADFDYTTDQMLKAARRFDAAKVKTDQIAGAAGSREG